MKMLEAVGGSYLIQMQTEYQQNLTVLCQEIKQGVDMFGHQVQGQCIPIFMG